MASIFVQIASYRDSQLLPTLRDLNAKAQHPDRLRFGICWQRDETESLEEFASDKRFRVIDVDYRESLGLGWARQKTQSLYEDEDFTFQVDSHHRFVEGWDEELLAMIKLADSPKPVLTAYAPAFDPFDTSGNFSQIPWALSFHRFTPDGVVFFQPVEINDWRERTRPIPGRFFSGHFSFTSGNFIREVPQDPNYYFNSEEINMTVRAFTHGYDFFYPHRMIMWHEYSRWYRRKHWDDHTAENGAEVPWTTRNEQTFQRNRLLFGQEDGEIDLGRFGFGTARSLQDYERFTGINFRLRMVQPYTWQNKPPPNPDIYTTDEEWIAGCMKDFWTRIRPPAEAIDRDADYDFWYVGVHDEFDHEIDRRDLDGDDVARLLAQPRIEFIHRYRAQEKAHSWTIWPHSRTRGWLEKLTMPLGR
jgi:UDP-N-acetylglucosamine (GlcNAc):hydroxyproline polypeptide GlcNAc-transferase